jgi:hypothetical protein
VAAIFIYGLSVYKERYFMSKIVKEYNKLAKQAKKVKGEFYPFHPDGKLIPRAKGTLTLTKK